MGRIKRVRKNKQRGMGKKFIKGKKPMTAEQKTENKKAREEQRTKSLAENASKKTSGKKE